MTLREEIPEKWKKFYEGFEKDLRENWINKKELEKRIDGIELWCVVSERFLCYLFQFCQST